MSVALQLSWQSEDGLYHVKISRRCILCMQRLAQQHRPNEVGTSLVGYYSDSGCVANIISLGPIPPDSTSGHTWFFRGIAGLPEFFQRLNRRFHGRRYRVGEWHSHPNTEPSPSPRDDRSQLDIARDKSECLPEAILIILGGDLAERSMLGVYVYSRKRGRLSLSPEPTGRDRA